MNDLEFAGRVFWCVKNGEPGAPDLLLQCQQNVDAARRAARKEAGLEAGENPDPPLGYCRPKPPPAPPAPPAPPLPPKATRQWPRDAQFARLSLLIYGLQVRVHDLELVGRGRQDELSAEIEKVREWCARHKHYFEVSPGVEVHQTRGPMDAGQL